MRQAHAIVQHINDTQQQDPAAVKVSLPQKSNLISCRQLVHISDIKLIKTETTPDLSQKAEKDMIGDVK